LHQSHFQILLLFLDSARDRVAHSINSTACNSACDIAPGEKNCPSWLMSRAITPGAAGHESKQKEIETFTMVKQSFKIMHQQE
jgi:hypothetical protein